MHNEKKLLCRRRCVPLRVPMCTLTDATLWFILCFSNCIKGCCLARSTARLSCRRRVRIHSVNPTYQLLNHYILCECLTSFASRWALLTIVPIPTGLHRPRKERGCYSYCPRLSCVSFICISMSKFNFCEQVGNRTPAAMGIGTKCDLPISCPFAGLALPAIIPIFAEPN